MNNESDKVSSSKEKLSPKNDTKNSQQGTPDKEEKSTEKKDTNDQLYKELLIEDNSSDTKNKTSNDNENPTESNNNKSIEKIVDLNDYYSSEEYNSISNRPKNIITVNDIIGEDTKKEINLDVMDESFNSFAPGKVSTKSYGPIMAYAANTNQGIARDYNEDRVSIIINVTQPNNKKINWPKASYFSVFDGHGGNKCAEFLRDNLLKLICDNDFFPNDVESAIKFGFREADKLFLERAAKDNELIDNSGSCGLILLIIDNKIYIANVGDSRCLISMNNGRIKKDVTRDHKPNYPYEKERIISNGGRIYQTQTPINNPYSEISNQNSQNGIKGENNNNINNLILLGPHRVFPGSLSVSRTIGDAAAKLTQFGGNPKVVISEPDIYSFDLEKEDIDFIILGCDGIYDQLTSQDVFKCAYMMIEYSKKYNLNEKKLNKHSKKEELNEIDLFMTCAQIVDFILKTSMSRKSFDNVTCVMVAFKDLLKNDNISENINDPEKSAKKSEINTVKKEKKLPKLNTNLMSEERSKTTENKKKIVIDKIRINSIQKEEKNKMNYEMLSNRTSKKLEFYPFGNESPNKNEINSGELSHRMTNNNMLKEFKYKLNKNIENENNIYLINKHKLTLSTTKLKKNKSKDLLMGQTRKNINMNLENKIHNYKEFDKNAMSNNINMNNNVNKKNLSINKTRLNTTKKFFLNKKIKPLFTDNKSIKTKNKFKFKNNFTIKLTTVNNNIINNYNYNFSNTKTGSSLNKLSPRFSELSLYQNLNMNIKEKNPSIISNNIPKITNINTLILNNNHPKNKLSLNGPINFSDVKNINNNNNNHNIVGMRLKSLNKKSISFYNNFALNELSQTPKNTIEKNLMKKNQLIHPQYDLFNINYNNARNSYENNKMKKDGNNIRNINENKYHMSNEDKYKIKFSRPNNICAVRPSNYHSNKSGDRQMMNELKGKRLIHNLTEDMLYDKIKIDNSDKNKMNNNLRRINII